MYKSFKYTPILKDVDKFLKKFTNKIESKLNETISLLNQTKFTIQKYKLTEQEVHSTLVPCGNETDIEDDLAKENFNIHRGTQVLFLYK